jgi:hypothetical protein
VLPACIVVAAGHVATGIALCIGLLPVALAGMRPARRGRIVSVWGGRSPARCEAIDLARPRRSAAPDLMLAEAPRRPPRRHGRTGRSSECPKVIKGGSFLCADSYCRRYRPAARRPQMIDTGMSHIGFRCVARTPR